MSIERQAEYGASIKRLRQGARMSQRQLAEAMQARGMTHWHQNTVSRIETGKQRPTVAESRMLGFILRGDSADAYDVSLRGVEDAFVDLMAVGLAYLEDEMTEMQKRVAQMQDALTRLRQMRSRDREGGGDGERQETS